MPLSLPRRPPRWLAVPIPSCSSRYPPKKEWQPNVVSYQTKWAGFPPRDENPARLLRFSADQEGVTTPQATRSTKRSVCGPRTGMPRRSPGPAGGTMTRVSSTFAPPLVKWQSSTTLTVPALLFVTYSTASQCLVGIGCRDGASTSTIGTEGPAVNGTVPISVACGCCVTIPGTNAPWARGSKARLTGALGLASARLPSTRSGVHTFPVRETRNSCARAVPARPSPTNASTDKRPNDFMISSAYMLLCLTSQPDTWASACSWLMP